MTGNPPINDASEAKSISPFRVTAWICCGVIVVSVLSCVAIASVRCTGLTRVRVTALDPEAEPKDHNLPFVKQKEALPDYQVQVVLQSGGRLDLGSRPDRSAAEGIDWSLSEPVAIHRVASIRLEDRDKLANDTLAEVSYSTKPVTDGNYRFEFDAERAVSIGVNSFFDTAIGKAIAAGFCIAVLILIFGSAMPI